MYELKMPLKYWGMLSCLSGPLGLGQVADTMIWGWGYLQSGGKTIYEHIHTEAT
jgi:hypothetical protein